MIQSPFLGSVPYGSSNQIVLKIDGCSPVRSFMRFICANYEKLKVGLFLKGYSVALVTYLVENVFIAVNK